MSISVFTQGFNLEFKATSSVKVRDYVVPSVIFGRMDKRESADFMQSFVREIDQVESIFIHHVRLSDHKIWGEAHSLVNEVRVNVVNAFSVDAWSVVDPFIKTVYDNLLSERVYVNALTPLEYLERAEQADNNPYYDKYAQYL